MARKQEFDQETAAFAARPRTAVRIVRLVVEPWYLAAALLTVRYVVQPETPAALMTLGFVTAAYFFTAFVESFLRDNFQKGLRLVWFGAVTATVMLIYLASTGAMRM